MSQVWRFWPWPEGDIDNDVFQFLFPENVRAGYQAIHVLSSPHVLCTENEADNFYPIKFSQWDTHQASRNMLKDVKGGEPAARCNLPNPQAGAPTCLQNSLVTTFESGSPAPYRTPTSTERKPGRGGPGQRASEGALCPGCRSTLPVGGQTDCGIQGGRPNRERLGALRDAGVAHC